MDAAAAAEGFEYSAFDEELELAGDVDRSNPCNDIRCGEKVHYSARYDRKYRMCNEVRCRSSKMKCNRYFFTKTVTGDGKDVAAVAEDEESELLLEEDAKRCAQRTKCTRHSYKTKSGKKYRKCHRDQCNPKIAKCSTYRWKRYSRRPRT